MKSSKRFRDQTLLSETTPNFFLVGAAKSGTTSLWQYLSSHPQIFMPRSVKEPHYFLWAEEDDQFNQEGLRVIKKPYHHDWQAYISLFKKANVPAIGEASVFYLPHRTAAPKIRSRCPEARIIVSLRNPVDRAWSWYRFNRMRHVEDAVNFQDALAREKRIPNLFYTYQYLGLGRYCEQVERYIQCFGNDRVHVVLFDDLIVDPFAVCQGIFSFLGLDPMPDLSCLRVHNVTKTRHQLLDPIYRLRAHQGAIGRVARNLHGRLSGHHIYLDLKQSLLDNLDRPSPVQRKNTAHNSMPGTIRAMLIDDFADDVVRLEQLINRDLSSWRRVSKPEAA